MPQHPALLDRRPHRPDPGQGFLGDLTLARGRVHEVCGPARWSAALMIAGGMQGPILWVRPAWDHGHLHGAGMMRFLDPGRVIFVDAPRAPEVLWTMEEALRAGSRWRMIPTHGTQDTAARENIEDQAVTGMRVSGESWRLIRERDRKRPPQGWRVGTTGTGFALGAEAEAAGAAPDRSVARSGLA